MVRGQSVVPAQNRATPGDEQQSPEDPPVEHASLGAVAGAFTLVALGGLAAWLLWSMNPARVAIRPADAGTTIMTLFAFAVAIERLLEPFSRWLPGSGDTAQTARGHADRAVVAWGLATAIASAASSGSGFYLLHAIAGPDWDGVAVWIDAVVTGLAIGGGTKPLHDLIACTQTIKERVVTR